MADWWVFQPGGKHLGPWSVETIAHEISTGQMSPAIYVGVGGADRWMAAIEVPAIAQLIATSGRAPPPGSRPPAAEGPPSSFGRTMSVSEHEVEILDAIAAAEAKNKTAPPPLPNALKQTLRMQSSPPASLSEPPALTERMPEPPSEQLSKAPKKPEIGKVTVERRSLDETFVLSDGPTSELLRRPSTKPPPKT